MIKKTALTYKYFVLHHQNNYNNPTNVGFFFFFFKQNDTFIICSYLFYLYMLSVTLMDLVFRSSQK